MTTTKMKRFVLVRYSDVSGVSGTGIVAEGVVFTNGSVCLSWLSDLTSMEIHKSIDNCVEIHGHNGMTVVEYIGD